MKKIVCYMVVIVFVCVEFHEEVLFKIKIA
jgi:hypothetical protein